LCSEDEQRSYGVGTAWGWVINDLIFIFGWTNPLSLFSSMLDTLFFLLLTLRSYSLCHYKNEIFLDNLSFMFPAQMRKHVGSHVFTAMLPVKLVHGSNCIILTPQALNQCQSEWVTTFLMSWPANRLFDF